jgi:hypothetical protein
MSLTAFLNSKEALAATEQAHIADSAWFIRHPDRKFHLREPFVGEFPFNITPPPGIRCVVVSQIATGHRYRQIVYVTKLLDTEDIARLAAETAFSSIVLVDTQDPPSNARH